MITVLIGPSGSGKSTLAKEMSLKSGAQIINRDKLREMAFSFDYNGHKKYHERDDFRKCEKEITKLEDNIIKSCILDKQRIILDNTHLELKVIETIIRKWSRFVDIQFKLVEAPKEVCFGRDSLRDRSVGAPIIKQQFEKLKKLKESFDFKTVFTRDKTYKPILGRPSCVIFDIDGTLADKGSRFAHDLSKVYQDTLRLGVYNSYRMHKNAGDTIIICTGRDEICEEDTKAWLADHGIEFDEFHIRKRKDNRPDWQVKEEFWESISYRYNIKLMYDDRDQVVEHARKLGFEVFQVQPGRF